MEAAVDPGSNERSSEDQKQSSLIDEVFLRLPKRRFKGRWTIHLGAKNYVKNYLCLVFLRDGGKENVDDWESQGRLDILSLSNGSSSTVPTARIHSRRGPDHRQSSFMALFKTFKTNTAAVCELDSSKFSKDDVKLYAKRDCSGILEQIQRSAWLCEYDELLRHVQAFLAENHRKSSSKTITLAVRWILDREIEDQIKDSRRDLALDREGHHHHYHRSGGISQVQSASAAAGCYHQLQHRHNLRNRQSRPQPQQQQERKAYRKHKELNGRNQTLESSEGDRDENNFNITTTATCRHLLDDGDETEAAAPPCCAQDGDCDSCPGDDTASLDDDDEDADQDRHHLLSSGNGTCHGHPNAADEGKNVEVELNVRDANHPPPSSPTCPLAKQHLRKRKMSVAGLRSRSVSPIAVISKLSSTQPPPLANRPSEMARVVVPSSIRPRPGLTKSGPSHLADVQELNSTEGKRMRKANGVHHLQKQAKTESNSVQERHKQGAPSGAVILRREQASPSTTIVTEASGVPIQKRKSSVPRHSAVVDEQIPGVPSSHPGQSILTGNNLAENVNRGKMNTIQMIRYIRKRWIEGGMTRNRAFKRLCAEDFPFKGMGGNRNEEIITAHDNYFQLAFRCPVIWDLVSRIFEMWEDGEIRGQSFHEDTDDVLDMKIGCWAKMQGITDGESDAIVPILKRVLSGELSLPEMAEKFTTYKIHRRMIQAFCKYLSCDTWDHCEKEYPTISQTAESED